jgi:MarR family transcriptional regulator, temperature-dependent positive regulator of motility
MKSPITTDIPFGAMVSITGRCRYIFLNDRLRPRGLSAGQVPVLMLLYKEQNIMQETLVQHYHIDKGTIARAVKKLKDAGYIRQVVDPANRRAVRLSLTEKGEKMAPILQAINSEWESRICAGLSEDEKNTLNSLMHTVAHNSLIAIKNSGDFFLEDK